MSESQIQITLPDGSQREYPRGVTGREVALSIGKKLAKAALGVEVNGVLQDLARPIEVDASVNIITREQPAGLEMLRHSAAHIMADAVKRIYPEAKLWKGPAVEDERYGFYYDIDLGEKKLTKEDLPEIEKLMRKIVKQDLPFERKVVDREAALAKAEELEEQFKTRTIHRIPEGEEISFYDHGDFTDLCTGPHIPSTGKLGEGFGVLSIAGAYIDDDASQQMLTRLYGNAFPDKATWEAHKKSLEEALKRDHRRLGLDLDLYSSMGEYGGGLILWHPKGGFIRHKMEEYWRNEHLAGGYDIVYSPHIAKADLWETSGHLDFYKESMYSAIEVDKQPYLLKPMNCPFHVMMYKTTRRSYREFPLRWAELGTVYRYEGAGMLHGLLRVRGFTQDDAHLFVRPDQLEEEIKRVLDFVLSILRAFGFEDFHMELSTRPEKSVGEDQIWEDATAALKVALDASGIEYGVDEGGGAFYGPKIDVKIKDCLGRFWQCSTIQVDFNLPERFDMTYMGEDGKKHRPIMIHRALLGSLERFFGILIEHYAGVFPLWLAPVQVDVLSVGERHEAFAVEAHEELQSLGIRSELDLGADKVGAKVRKHLWQDKKQFVAVVGDTEVEAGKLALRHRTDGDLGQFTPAELAAEIQKRVEART